MTGTNDIVGALHMIKPGERVVYHRGLLANDRMSSRNKEWRVVTAIGEIAWAAMMAGKIFLTQRRIGELVVEYIAIGAPKGTRKVKWDGCYSPDYEGPAEPQAMKPVALVPA